MPSAANHAEEGDGGWGVVDTAQSLSKAVSFANSHSACDYEEAMREHSMKKSNSLARIDVAVAATPEKLHAKPEPWYKRAWKAVASVPNYWWISLLLFALLETAAVVGSIYFAKTIENTNKSNALDIAVQSSRCLQSKMDDQRYPVLSVAALIRTFNGSWPTVESFFPGFAESLYNDGFDYFMLEVLPRGWVGTMALPWLNLTGKERDIYLNDYEMGQDMLEPGRWDTEINIKGMKETRMIAMDPWYMPSGDLVHGAIVLRYAIYMEQDPAHPWDIPTTRVDPITGEVKPLGFYDLTEKETMLEGTNLSFWGWSNSIFSWRTIQTNCFTPMTSRGLLFSLSPDRVVATNQSYLAMSDPVPRMDAECISVPIFGWMSWTLCVSHNDSWGPVWLPALIVGFSIIAIVISVLVFFTLKSRDTAVKSAQNLLAANEQLEEDRRRMDLLLGRQHQLISLFKQDGQVPGMDGSINQSVAADSAADRIWEIRKQLAGRASAGSFSEADDTQLHEILGEGSFGKVYRGTWHGTEVAVKTIILPLSMSGDEKREKMLLMEAAISSSLAHPNIVQTFTYTIAMLKENEDKNANMLPEGMQIGANASMMSSYQPAVQADKTGVVPGSTTAANGGSHVHGYEVRLVLEYCDKGCLRDALSGSAFLGENGLNYKAILDTALDIAKAMVHLHHSDIMHGDLKVRNVMLKSSGSEGRGVVSKVADFGLAMKIDASNETHMSNVFQGTLTHMAPELLLHGHMSKAADVYAFGITLWELFTGGNAYKGVPQVLLGHQVIHEKKRPAFVVKPPAAFAALVDSCWAHEPSDRPTFTEILAKLQALRKAEPGPTPPIGKYSLEADIRSEVAGGQPGGGGSPNAAAPITKLAAAGSILKGQGIMRPTTLPAVQEANIETSNEQLPSITLEPASTIMAASPPFSGAGTPTTYGAGTPTTYGSGF